MKWVSFKNLQVFYNLENSTKRDKEKNLVKSEKIYGWIIVMLASLFISGVKVNYAQEKVFNLDCINEACHEIVSNEINAIANFAGSGKVMVLPFYSDAAGAILSYPIAIELKESLQKKAQEAGVNLTFNYLNEYNKEGNKEINHPPLDSDFDWDAYIKKFEHNYYVEGHYVVEINADGQRTLVLKNINLKPNDITAQNITKLALKNVSASVTSKDVNAVLKDKKAKTRIYIKSNEMVSDEESWILLTELKTYLNEMGYLVTNKADEADFSVDVKAKTNRTNSPYPSAFFHWIDIRILIKTSEDPVPIYTKKWDAKKGSSNVSFDDAATKILNEVAEEIAEQNIINVIQEQLTNNIW